ncbi:alpha-D-mannose-specific plant lectins domain-containing protein [Dioscorea alata]|uniref:Alpha-D-mannose-specific plant lectins domain-containing protein n=1 Tax=Dioscorea alata TaxID=55571 RepID=A0ACB7UUC6_DIOAL|nr:alpha-D-mannose-specific plant lectins domain-containing protein [Dioscorea alata]
MHCISLHFILKQTKKLIIIMSYSSFIFLILFILPSIHATIPSGTIQRTTKQQILATVPPTSGQPSPFLSSPSGKYTAYLVRHETAPGAGGFGNDFCYIQVQETSSGQSLWESECAPASNENTCALVFDDNGLEVFDGSNPIWDTGAESADDNPLELLEMVDEGDMRIRDQIGELAWKASDDPRANQGCGEPGSPGLAPAMPPFAVPIGGGNNLPFGQQQQQQGQQNSGAAFNQESGGLNGQPLVDNTAFFSGSCKSVELKVIVVVMFSFLGLGFGF